MKSLVFLFLTLSSQHVFSQIKFNDSSTSWQELSGQAQKEDKLIFVHFESNSCQQCNEVASQGFDNSQLTEKFAKNFISIRLNVETENGKAIKDTLQVQGSLISVFADAYGNILERQNGSTNNATVYSDKADVAISRKGKKGITAYSKEYQAGSRSTGFLKEYLDMLKQLDMDNGEVLDEYTAQLPPDSLKHFGIVKFIYQQGPTLDSKTYQAIREFTPRKLIDSLHRSVPFQEAVNLNNGIIGHSMRKAIMKKDLVLAEGAAWFARATYDRDPKQGQIAYEKNMLFYLHATRDSTEYLRRAARFIERYYLNISLDSLKGLDQAEKDKMLAVKPKMKDGVTVMSFKFTNPSQFYPMELNNRAWHFYQLASRKEDLEKALEWSKLAMEWSEALLLNENNTSINGNPSYVDTYAHLLYKLGRKNEAIEWQTKALERQKRTGQPHGAMETALIKMKAGTL
ncbi:thioredoxin family protein [Dyadobacter aurulentus]|uniref:thioredoxin family protein n=1 Tax=Dyadobacter sp. UC 10 TaxID=2605428 RepID=UPI0011F3DA2D|nr:DUF255 domain-containing protein [Dyadobacter sp. UC 10]KAA0992393.1 DUF255 domain-containing protein [Dyadobacter sp. UC 10]